MVPKIKIGFISLTALAMLVLLGCEHSSDDIPTGNAMSVEYYIDSGWNNFINSDYTHAILDFNESYSRDALATEAYLGIGWSYLRDSKYNQAISSIYNVFSLTELGMVEPADTIRYLSDSYACLAGAYQGLYPEDIENFAPSVIENVDKTLENSPDFVFTYDEDVNRQTLIVAKADAYFVLNDFVNALKTITQLDEDSSLYNNSLIMEPTVDTVEVETLFDSTTVYGYGRLTIEGAQIIDVEKVTDDSLTNFIGNLILYQIAGFVQGGSDITFYGTPVPQAGYKYIVTYYNSPDYTAFLTELRELIDSFR